MTKLNEYVATHPRFGRSANVERDFGESGVRGYMPTGRAMDVIERLARGLNDSSAGRTFSITGPHGGGKSSLAVFLTALTSPLTSPESRAAMKILKDADLSTAEKLANGIQAVGGASTGFITAAATARSESVATTIGRALFVGATRTFGFEQQMVPAYFGTPTEEHQPTESAIRETVTRLCEAAPVILIIDEFGKNLESYAKARSSGDPYLLQELAEATQGGDALPLVVVTMQHLAFDEYVQETSASRRREWAKVQGRFQDIPYVETPEQARRLIVETLEQRNRSYRSAAQKWVRTRQSTFAELNMKELLAEAPLAFPLHPVTLAALPDLCTRYGQNERTLFSFMAGSEPLAVPAFLEQAEWSHPEPLPLVGLDRVYDFFLDSVASMVGVSENASRWVEIETRIRDTAGLKPSELKALKTIGVLNLISSGGKLRASRSMLEFALQTDTPDPQPADDAEQVLKGLEERGLLVYRTFSDEYRIWQGSDYDLKRAIASARRQCVDTPLADLLNAAADLQPVVAGKHSQRTGVLRIFGQRFSDLQKSEDVHAQWDGLVLFSTESSRQAADSLLRDDKKPIVVVSPGDVTDLRDAAIEAAALRLALAAAEVEGVDWVARRELSERTAAGQQSLRRLIAATWDYTSDWTFLGSQQELRAEMGLSRVLSEVSDAVYTGTPRIANEMIARRELTSQGAKARRMLIDAMLERSDTEAFGIEGYGPERAIYEAIFRSTGLHRETEDGRWELGRPTDRLWRSVWRKLDEIFDGADVARVGLHEVMHQLELPPYGLKEGVLPLVLIAALLVRSDDVAVYEHGSLVLSLDDAVCERLAKNPNNFTVRNSGTRDQSRRVVVEAIAVRMGINGRKGESPSFLNVTTALFRELRLLPPYTQKTKAAISPAAIRVREAFQTASEPDVLIFETLPEVFGMKPFRARGRTNQAAADTYAQHLADSIVELRSTYGTLLKTIAEKLAEAASLPDSAAELQDRLSARATELDGKVLEPRLRAFVGALTRPHEYAAWLENVAMVVAEGQAPRIWTDDIAARFPLRIAELGGAMRRTEALLYERLAQDHAPGSFSAHRITLTRPDGTEWNQLLAMSESERQLVDAEFDSVIERMAGTWGSRAAACRMLMARLAVEELDTPSTPVQIGDEGGRDHG